MKISMFSTAVCFHLLQLAVAKNSIISKPKHQNFQTRPNLLSTGTGEFKHRNILCEIDTSEINLPTNDAIDLKLVTDGSSLKTIHCSRRKQLHAHRNPNMGKGWHGICDGDARDLVFVERNGKLTGSIHIGDESCIIHPSGAVVCTPLAYFPDEDDALEISGDADGSGDDSLDSNNDIGDRQLEADHDVTNFISGFVPTNEQNEKKQGLRGTYNSNNSNDNNRRRLYDDSGSTIDVMVVWTKEAECRYNGLSDDSNCILDEASEESFLSMVYLLVLQANTSFAASGVDFQIRLVHAYRHEDYEEPSSIRDALISLNDDDDGQLDDVHARRSLYGADLVQMIIGRSGCGTAVLGPSKTKAFSVTQYTCAINQYSFVHELAHSLGAHHDRGSLDRCDEQGDTYRYGWRDPAERFRSIMAYSCEKNQCDNLTGKRCDRVLMFSNPTIPYDDGTTARAIGDARHDNVRILNENRATVANWYPAMDCESDEECDDHDTSTLDRCDADNRVCVFTIAPTTAITTASPIPSPTSSPTLVPTHAATTTEGASDITAPTQEPTDSESSFTTVTSLAMSYLALLWCF